MSLSEISLGEISEDTLNLLREVESMMNEDDYDQIWENYTDELKPSITDEFLSVLAKAVKTYGWSGDHVETVEFVEWCFKLAGKEAPDLTPLMDQHD